MREYSASKAGSVPPRQLFCQTDKTVCAMRRRCASHRIAGRSNHRFIAGSVLQKEMPSEWMASLFGAGYGNRTRLCGLGSDRSTDELTLRCGVIIADPKRKCNSFLSLQTKQCFGEHEIHQQTQCVHDGGNKGAGHDRRVEAQPLGKQGATCSVTSPRRNV